MKKIMCLVAVLCGLSAIAATHYQLNDGVTMTSETINGVTYYRTSDGDEFTSVSLDKSQDERSEIYKEYLNTETALVKIDRPDELRFWRDKSGNQILAKLISKSGKNVVLAFEDGSRKMLPIAGLSSLDQEYITYNALPSIELDVGKIKVDQGSIESIRFKVKAKYTSTYDFPLGINIHIFVFSESDELIRHEHRDDIEFEGPDNRFEFETSAFTFVESTRFTANQSSIYGGYLVVATDSKHRIISTKYTNDKAKKKLDKLIQYGIKKVQVDGQLPFRELSPYSPSARL